MSNDSAKPNKYIAGVMAGLAAFAAPPTTHEVQVDIARLEKTIERVRRDSEKIDNRKCMIFADRKSGLYPLHAIARDEKRLDEEIAARDTDIATVNDSLAALKVMGRRSPLAKADLERFQTRWTEVMNGVAATDRATERFQKHFDAAKGIPTPVQARPIEDVVRDAITPAPEPALAGTAPAPEEIPF